MGAIVELDNALLTFGNVFWHCRRKLRISQREMAARLARFGPIDYIVLSKIENDRLDINESKWDWLIAQSASVFGVDVEWLEEIRRQTTVTERDEDSPHIACFKTRPPRIKY